MIRGVLEKLEKFSQESKKTVNKRNRSAVDYNYVTIDVNSSKIDVNAVRIV